MFLNISLPLEVPVRAGPGQQRLGYQTKLCMTPAVPLGAEAWLSPFRWKASPPSEKLAELRDVQGPAQEAQRRSVSLTVAVSLALLIYKVEVTGEEGGKYRLGMFLSTSKSRE